MGMHQHSFLVLGEDVVRVFQMRVARGRELVAARREAPATLTPTPRCPV
jgi:hypothetical protein